MRTTTALLLTAAAAAVGSLKLPVVDAQNATAASCLDCASFAKSQCEANNGDGECVWGGARAEQDKRCQPDSGEGCKGCGCDASGGAAGAIFLVVLLLIIIGSIVLCVKFCSCCNKEEKVTEKGADEG